MFSCVSRCEIVISYFDERSCESDVLQSGAEGG